MERRDLELVWRVRQAGSLVGAAEALGVVPSVVTRRLAALEAHLGQRLFERSTRRLQPTPEGEALCTHATALLAGFEALEDELRERQSGVTGDLRIASSLGFGRHWVGPALAALQVRHPQLRVELVLNEQLPDLAAQGFDGAVWLWSPPPGRDGQWMARRLARNQRVLVGAPSYLARRGAPERPEDLAGHACLVVREHTAAPAPQPVIWLLRHESSGRTTRVPVQGPLASNSGELVRDWCLAGHGIMLRSLWDVGPLLSSGALVRVLPEHAMTDADIHWLAPWRPRMPRRVRLVVDHLAECFRSEPWKPAPAPRISSRR